MWSKRPDGFRIAVRRRTDHLLTKPTAIGEELVPRDDASPARVRIRHALAQ
jgi:hypothetical protein